MNGSDIIKLFFSKMKCSNCDHFFNEEDITVLRDEGDYIVARIYCSRCGKNVGIALLGLDREMMKKTLEASDTKSISGKEDEMTGQNLYPRNTRTKVLPLIRFPFFKFIIDSCKYFKFIT